MRLRGLVFERFATFERAEVNVCDESGAPLDVVLFVGPSGAGKSALLRGVSSLLAEAAGGESEVGEEDVRRQDASSSQMAGESSSMHHARCRVVFDDVVDGSRFVITLEKLIPEDTQVRSSGAPLPSKLRASLPDAFERWRRAIDHDVSPRAAFSIASSDDSSHEAKRGCSEDVNCDRDSLVDWFRNLRGGPKWEAAVLALDRVLWPYRFDHVSAEGDVHFSSPSGLVSSGELGAAFGSVFVMALELLRLSTECPTEELVYVIDDIDAHLDPRWQSRIIGDLRRVFPRVQLVATTHSPWVVAAVEPHQVFRLERPSSKQSADQGTTIVRVSDRIQRGGTVSQIMDLAFGTPDLPGPRWLHAPPFAVRQEVLRSLENDLTRAAVVYAFPEAIHVRDVRDAFGEPTFLGPASVMGHLFFVDLEPGGAWGHPCEYIFRSRDGQITRQRAIWPPSGLDRFVPIGRG